MSDEPIFNKISDAISFIVQARAEEIERTYSSLFPHWQPFPIDKLRKIILKDCEELLDCPYSSIDENDPDYIRNLIFREIEKLCQFQLEPFKKGSEIHLPSLTNTQLLQVKNSCLQLSKLAFLLRLVVPQSYEGVPMLSFLLNVSVIWAKYCTLEQSKRMIQKPFPTLTAAFIVWGQNEVTEFLQKVIENTTKGLSLPGPNEDKARYQKIGSGTETESLLNKLLTEDIHKAWIQVVKRHKIDEAFLGEVEGVMFIPHAVCNDFLNELERDLLKEKGIPRKQLRERHATKKYRDMSAKDEKIPDEFLRLLEDLEQQHIVNVSVVHTGLKDFESTPTEIQLSNEMVEEYFIKDPERTAINTERNEQICSELRNWAGRQPKQAHLVHEVVEYMIRGLTDPATNFEEAFKVTKIAEVLNIDKKEVRRIFNKIKEEVPFQNFS
ncbi:MAG: hypothetical protein ACM3SR_16155 [Ignavibacteriales bacterium]